LEIDMGKSLCSITGIDADGSVALQCRVR
jgi:hypothetical protein